MAREHNRNDASHPRGMSRRTFIKLAAMTGLLAGCRPLKRLVTPVLSEVEGPTSTPPPTPTPAPTTPPTAVPTATPTSAPTDTPATTVRRPEIIKFYPDVPSKIVHTHHAGAWDSDALVPEAIRQMLDTSITELTGLDDAGEAWASLFDPGERVAIKVNAFRNSIIWTHVPLVMAVTECLQEVGVPAEQIVIFDYYTSELEEAGYPVNEDGPGVRCYGTDSNYTSGWQLAGRDIRLSDVVLDCDALINMPVLKSHMISGISFAMKNHYGTFDRPSSFHRPRIERAIAELNALPPIKGRTRLIIGDVLTACIRYASSWPYWSPDVTGDSILMSFDPVAHDTVGLQTLSQLLTDDGGNPAAITGMATPCLESGAELGLGTSDLTSIELVEVTLG
ncbi:MAG: DUF362 domain-containing protein [Anaerolineae bacterium]|nr:DUF362 domain-containing protein [Anaerolineae bacterium]